MTRAEALAFNAGVQAVLAIAARTADSIGKTTQRRVHEEFAVAALAELAEAGKALLLLIDPKDGIAHGAPSP